MSIYYTVTSQLSFGVLADSQEEAEQIAGKLTAFMEDEMPPRARLSLEVQPTLNQADYIKREAVNYGAIIARITGEGEA